MNQSRPVPFKVTDPELVPARRYYDEDFFRQEKEHLWPHVWQMACRLEEIPEVGDFIDYSLFEDSVIVVRTDAGVKAFHNACRHRGVRLAEGRGNCKTQGFICPFHGWRWNSKGENTFVFSRNMFSEHVLEPTELNLTPCRVELWGGCAFINFDDNAPSLMESIHPVAERMDARHVDQMKVEWWRSTVLPVNWKLAMEAFMEGYHVMRTHPQLHRVTIPGTDLFGQDMEAGPARTLTGRESAEITAVHLRLLGEGMDGMVHVEDMAIAEELCAMDLPEEMGPAMRMWMGKLNEEITKRAQARGIPMPDLVEVAKNHPYSPVEFVFPNYFMLPMFGNMASYRIRPLTPETCLFELWALTLLPVDEKARGPLVVPTPVPHDSDAFPEIPRQDYSNLPRQQLGLHARGFENMRLSREVEGLISNYHRLIDAYIEGVDNERLVPAIQDVNGRYQGPIKDMDL